MNIDRWPPVYDFDDLQGTIKSLIDTQELFSNFYDIHPEDVKYCQGDILHFETPAPVFDENGNVAVIDEFSYWMIIGNTCDLQRDLNGLTWTQVVPLVNISDSSQLLSNAKQYKPYRTFYLPPWDDTVEDGYVADFTMPATIHKSALENLIIHGARLTKISWVLLHSCLVRFLARDDGRLDSN